MIGNIDPLDIIRLYAEPIRDIGRRCLSDGVDVIAPVCGLDPATPLRNLAAIAEALGSQ